MGRKRARDSYSPERPDGAQMISGLPLEILIDILCRLPLISVIHCRRVCCTLRKVITSNAQFAETHFSRATLQFLLRSGGFCRTLQLFHIDRRPNDDVPPAPLAKFRLASCDPVVLNSCNGFLCLGAPHHFNPVVILNPVTGEFINLPISRSDDDIESEVISGFGYGSVTKKFKIVRLVYRVDDDDDDALFKMAEIYTLGQKSWRKIGYAPEPPRLVDKTPYCYYPNYMNGTFLNGLFHWVSPDHHHKPYDQNSYSIISFDFDSEKFGSVPAPSSFRKRRRGYWADFVSMGVLGGCLYVNDDMGLWVMKDYGVGESWTRVCQLRRDMNWPIKYLNDGHILANGSNKELFYLNTAYSNQYVIRIPGLSNNFRIIPYTPSFFRFEDIVGGDNGDPRHTKVFRIFAKRAKK